MTPPIGNNYQARPTGESLSREAPPTMRADLLPDEYRLFCPRCGGVTVHRVEQAPSGAWRGECTECGPAGEE